LRPTLAVVATAVWGVLAIPGLLGAALSPMFFDAPGSMNNPVAWINAAIVVSFPLLCLISIAGSWVVWALRKRSATKSTAVAQVVVACVPLLPVAYVFVALVVETAGVLLSGQPLGLHSTIIQH
jgi:hypothetical protein